MKKLTTIFSIVLLSACGSDSSKSSRDLTGALTLDELIEKRMNNDATLDGETVLINDELTASFTSYVCNPSPPIPCTDDEFSSEVSEPVYQGAQLGCADGFYISSRLGREVVGVNLKENTDFYLIDGFKQVTANFYAEVKFVERSPWCSAQVNYGLSITLKEGEEQYLLNQFIY